MIYKKSLDDVLLWDLWYRMEHSSLDNVLDVVDGVNFLLKCFLKFPLKVLEISIMQICF